MSDDPSGSASEQPDRVGDRQDKPHGYAQHANLEGSPSARSSSDEDGAGEQANNESEEPSHPHLGLRVGPWLDLPPPAPEPDLDDVPEPADAPQTNGATVAVAMPDALRPRGVPTHERDSGGGRAEPAGPSPTSAPAFVRDGRAPVAAVGMVRRWTREYAWLLASAGVAVAVLLLSAPLLAHTGPTWNRGDSAAIGKRPAPRPGAPIAAMPTPGQTAVTPSPTRRSPGIAQGRAQLTPTSELGALDGQPVALGPDGVLGLPGMLRDFCRARYPDFNADARLRSGADPATDNWECRLSGARDDPLIDLNEACRWRYGPSSFARYSDARNAYSWRCFAPAS